jgi:phage/plasmid-like protein (TIGR03299 family)
MAHQITAQDSLVLFKNAAWHGLGNVVSEEMSPTEALVAAGLDWKLELSQSLKATMPDGTEIEAPQSKILFRAPRNENESYIHMCHFGDGFRPIQNEEIAEMAYAFGADVKVESAGSLNQGKRVWFLLRGETLSWGQDAVQPYLGIVNGNDGKLALSVMPTSVRIVCNNTLTQAISSAKGRMFRIAHSVNYKARMKECAELLKKYKTVEASFAANIDALVNKQVKSEKACAEFWQKAFTSLYGNPEGDKAKARALETMGRWDSIMKSEMLQLDVNSPSYWLLANAVTNDLQHAEPHRETEGWQERRVLSNMFGDNMTRSADIMALAYSL